MRFFLLSVSIVLVSANHCSDPDGTGPCGFGGSCDAGEVCVTESPDGTFVCCKKANVVDTTKAPPATTADPSCKDKLNPQTGVSDCPRLAYLCTDGQYKPLMKDQCPKTCGYCGSGGPVTSSPCVDGINPNTGRSDCPALKYLCQDTTYKPLMKEQCPKTCGYCQ